MKTISTLLLVAFVALSWSCGEAQNCATCSPGGRVVCGVNMNTDALVLFTNMCYMNRYRCLTGNDYQFVRYDDCPDMKSLSY